MGKRTQRVDTLLRVHRTELLEEKHYWLERESRNSDGTGREWIEAIDWIVTAMGKLGGSVESEYPIARRSEPGDRVTFAQFSVDYLAYVKSNFAVKTLENAQRVVKLIVGMFPNKDIGAFTAEDLEKFKTKRTQDGVSRTTINIDIRTIKAMFNVAVEWKRVAENPFKKTKQLKIDQMPKRVLSQDEFAAIITAIREPWLRDIISFNVLTGLRLGEIMNPKWTDYNAGRSEIVVRSSTEYRVKGGKMRVIPLGADARAILDGKKRRKEWIFVGDSGKKYTDDYISKRFKIYVRELGLPEEIHYHRLRDTYCTWLAEANVPIHIIKALAGHSTVRVTEGYISTNTEVTRTEVAKIQLPKATRLDLRVEIGKEPA